ncbi:MAG: Bug family tripartite tricarboxylate transporter substrate binding protein [Alphaproteobacteria bacterium]
MRIRVGCLLGVLAAAVAAGTTPAKAQSTPYYQGKTFTVVIGYPPGGGYDAYGRLFAAHIGKHLPGKPTVVVQNMPGASSIRSANFIHAKAARDGTVVGLFASSAAFAPVLGNKAAQFKPSDFTWIGNLERATGTCSVWKESGLSRFQDILEKEVIFGASGPAGFDSEYSRAINALFGTRIRVIHGYNGATSVLLAMKRGEVQGGCGFPLASLVSVRRDDFQAGRLAPIIQFALKSDVLKGVPHVTDLARSSDDRKVFNLIFNRDILGRPIAAPPGLPKERADALRVAFEAMVKDSAFGKDAERRHLALEPQSGTEVENFVREMTGYSPEIVDRAKQALVIGKVENVELKSLTGVIARVSKGGVEVWESSGRTVNLKVSGRRTAVLVDGAKAGPNALKAGMTCTFRHFGAGDFAKTVACK